MTNFAPETPSAAPSVGPIDLRAWQALSLRWSALHDAANAVAGLAGLAPEKPDPAVRGFPGRVRDAGGRRFQLVDHGVADIAAIMQPGLAALLAVSARGQDATAPALALWQEFHAARAAVMGLLPDDGATLRSA